MQKKVLCRGITAELSSIQEILEKSKDIEDSSQYNIGLRIVQEDPVLHQSASKVALRISKPMFTQSHKSSGFRNKSSKPIPGSRPPMLARASSHRPHVPNITGTDAPPKEGELRCYECGKKGHINPQYPKLNGKQRVARTQFEEVVDEDNQMDVKLTGIPNNTQEELDPLLKEGKIWMSIQMQMRMINPSTTGMIKNTKQI